MRATGMAIFSLVMFSACNCLARMQNQPDPQSSGDELTVQEKKAIAKQKDILDEIMRLYAENSLDRPADFTACVREMLAMSRSKKCRDKFTHYETPEVAKQRNDDYAGQFGGIGLELMEEDGAVIITTPMVGTPSARAGFKAKDIILKVGGQEPEDINEAIAWIRGKPGTKVTLTVFRPATKQKLDFTLTREIINVQTVKWRVSSTDPKIGIVEIHKFDETVPLKFAEAIIALVKKKRAEHCY